MLIIFAGNSAEAHAAARLLKLRPPYWAYLSNLNKLRRLAQTQYDPDSPLRVLYHGTYRKRADYEEVEAALFHLGATREILHHVGTKPK